MGKERGEKLVPPEGLQLEELTISKDNIKAPPRYIEAKTSTSLTVIPKRHAERKHRFQSFGEVSKLASRTSLELWTFYLNICWERSSVLCSGFLGCGCEKCIQYLPTFLLQDNYVGVAGGAQSWRHYVS